MNKTISSAMILALTSVATFGVWAGERAPRQASEPVRVSAPANSAPVDERAVRRTGESCVKETGTRIRAGSGREGCRFAGRSYSREDMDRTGEIDVGRALQRLDPSIQGGRW